MQNTVPYKGFGMINLKLLKGVTWGRKMLRKLELSILYLSVVYALYYHVNVYRYNI